MASKRSIGKTPRKSVPAPPPRAEWLFRKSEVPDDELVACVCWEYLREVRVPDLGPKGLSEYATGLLVGYRSDPERQKFSDSFDAIPLGVLAYVAEHAELTLPLPAWQKLDPGLRQELNRPASRAWSPLIPLTVNATTVTSWSLNIVDPGEFPNPRAWLQQAPELYAFAVANNARYNSTDGVVSVPTDAANIPRTTGTEVRSLPPHDPRFWLMAYAANGFAAPVPFLINWAEYGVDEIIVALSEWVRETKPKFTPMPREAGTKFRDLRGHLRDLGASRILKLMTEDQFKGLDEEYDLLRRLEDENSQKKKAPNLDLGKMRAAAMTYFKERFARDPAQVPHSWQPRRPRGANRY